MKKLCGCADKTVKQSTWFDIGLIKLCLCSLGILIGLSLPKEKQKTALAGASVLFSITFCPLIVRYSKRMIQNSKKK